MPMFLSFHAYLLEKTHRLLTFYPHWATLSDIGRHTSTLRFWATVFLFRDKRGRGAVAEPIKTCPDNYYGTPSKIRIGLFSNGHPCIERYQNTVFDEKAQNAGCPSLFYAFV